MPSDEGAYEFRVREIEEGTWSLRLEYRRHFVMNHPSGGWGGVMYFTLPMLRDLSRVIQKYMVEEANA